MEDGVLLMVWLIALFVLVGCVVLAVRRFVSRDSLEYDKQFIWMAYRTLWSSERNKDSTNDDE